MNIVILEKNSVYRESLKVILNQIINYNVIYDDNNCSKLKSLTKNKSIDLILLDCKIASESKCNFIIKLKEHFPNVKIIVLTDYPELVLYSSFFELGADTIIQKIASKKLFESTINNLLTQNNLN